MNEQTQDLSYLSNITLDVVEKIAPKRREAVVKSPDGTKADLRVFANGKIFPSKEFVEAYKLEYMAKDEKGNVLNNGLDIFHSDDWGTIQGKLPKGVKLIFIAAVPKALPKVNVFGSTKYNDDGSPKASAMTQGAQTFGKKTLIPMIKDAYNVDVLTSEYVDLKVGKEEVKSPDNIYWVPKTIATGERQGQATYERRENLEVHPLTVVHVEPSKEKKEKQLDMFEGSDTKPSLNGEKKKSKAKS